jgi:hypothetical protein
VVSGDRPDGYKLFRGAATFKNEDTETISNMISYDYSSETQITVTTDNYLTSTVALVDKPGPAPEGKVWVYRVVAERYGLTSESSFTPIALLKAPAVPSDFTVKGWATDSTKAQITWDVPEEQYDAKFKLEKIEIGSYKTGVSPVNAQVGDITSTVGNFLPAATSDGIILPANYLEGRAVVVDNLTNYGTRKQWLYRLTITKDGLSSECFEILNDPAFVAATGVSLSNGNTSDPINDASVGAIYQSAGTIRLRLMLSNTYWDDKPAIEIYKRKTSDPEEAYVLIPATTHGFTADAAIAAGSGDLYWTDSDVKIGVTYVYKVELTKTIDGSVVTFDNSGDKESSPIEPANVDPATTRFTFSAFGSTDTIPSQVTGTVRIKITASGGDGYAYLNGAMVRYQVVNSGVTTPGPNWSSVTVVRNITNPNRPTGTPTEYNYSIRIPVNAGLSKDVLYYWEGVQTPESANFTGMNPQVVSVTGD